MGEAGIAISTDMLSAKLLVSILHYQRKAGLGGKLDVNNRIKNIKLSETKCGS